MVKQHRSPGGPAFYRYRRRPQPRPRPRPNQRQWWIDTAIWFIVLVWALIAAEKLVGG